MTFLRLPPTISKQQLALKQSWKTPIGGECPSMNAADREVEKKKSVKNYQGDVILLHLTGRFVLSQCNRQQIYLDYGQNRPAHKD
jgi:hypothetical protein